MVTKKDFSSWVQEALEAYNGRAAINEVSKYIWEKYESELRKSGDLFYTWQYDIRWAAYQLRREGVMRPAELSPVGIWELY